MQDDVAMMMQQQQPMQMSGKMNYEIPNQTDLSMKA
jgi:hypothetical protein